MDQPNAQVTLERTPDFDGKVVDDVAMKFSGLASAIPCEDKVLRIDNVVRVTMEGVVTAVEHKVDKDGNLIRIQTVKPQDVQFTPFDPDDPADDGVLRGDA